MRRLLGLSTLLVVLAGPVLAQPIVDGTIAGDSYGPAASVQAVDTQFAGSELDAAYCTTDGSRLYLALTGNLAQDIAKLEIFIDSRAGGENVLSGVPGNDGANNMTGLTFDPGFAADFHIIVRHTSNPSRFELDFAELGLMNYASYGDVFLGAQQGSGVTGIGFNTQPIGVGFNNSNVLGVGNGTAAANQAAALAVQTGIELSIALSDLGYIGAGIRVCAFANNQDHNYASNQFLGPLPPPQGSLGGDGNGGFTGLVNFDLGTFAGTQYFTCAERTVPVNDATWSRIKGIYR